MTSRNPVLGVPLMDEDHARLEALFERVAETADAGLRALLAEAEAETRAHFDREETLMQSADVPAYHCHMAQHKQLLAEFTAAHYAAENGDMTGLRSFLGRILPVLVEAHVDSVDRVTASFLKSEANADDFSGLRLPHCV
jgi:hemerythrin